MPLPLPASASVPVPDGVMRSQRDPAASASASVPDGLARDRSRCLALTLALTAMLTPLAACGRKEVPLPPQIRRAATTRDLKVIQEGAEAVLTWGYPAITTAGGPLPDVEAVEVWRLAVPAAQEPQGTSSSDRQVREQLIAATGERLATLDPEALAKATRGPDLELRDDLTAWHDRAAPSEPMVLWYAVRTLCCRGRRSALSNIARLRPQLPPEPPAGLTGTATATGIQLEWQAPDANGVVVERAAPGGEWQRMTSEVVTATSWTDTSATQGATWRYRLRAVVEPDNSGVIVGPAGAEVEVEHPDVYPPQAPEAVVCLPEGSRVIVRWQAVPGAEWYEIERSGDGAPDAARVERTRYEDEAPPLGTVIYAVRAVDASGNRSESGSCRAVVGIAP